MAKSSIHIEAGHAGYLAHNDRSEKTVNSIFKNTKNEVWNDKAKAFSIYRKELSKRTKAYTKRTKQKLQSKSITHLSAIVNLNSNHKMSDLKKIKLLLEKELDTKVFQLAIHRDEGHINDDKKEVVNYHAHIEFMGLDSDGHSVRKKLTKKCLSDLQSDVAMVLEMERGKNYAKARESRPRRLSTHDFKEHKKLEQEQRQKIAVEHENNLAAKEKKHLAKIKDINLANQRLRRELQESNASREDYSNLEALVKGLKEKARAKELEHEEMMILMEDMVYTQVVDDFDFEKNKVITKKESYKKLFFDIEGEYRSLEYYHEELIEKTRDYDELNKIAYHRFDERDYPDEVCPDKISYQDAYAELKDINSDLEDELMTVDKLHEETKLALARFEELVKKLEAKGIDIYKLAEDKPKPNPPKRPPPSPSF